MKYLTKIFSILLIICLFILFSIFFFNYFENERIERINKRMDSFRPKTYTSTYTWLNETRNNLTDVELNNYLILYFNDNTSFVFDIFIGNDFSLCYKLKNKEVIITYSKIGKAEFDYDTLKLLYYYSESFKFISIKEAKNEY